MPLKKAVIVPGNGAGDVERANWYGWANKEIKKVGQYLESDWNHLPMTIYAFLTQIPIIVGPVSLVCCTVNLN